MDARQIRISPETRGREPRGSVRPTSLTLVLPAFNEEESIEQAVREAHEALRRLCAEFEVLVVDDGSTDATALIANRLAEELGSIRVLQQPRNMGYGAALRRGFQAARTQLVAFTDADCQFNIWELERMMLLARDYDIVCGYRIDRQDPWHRRAYSKGYNFLVRTLLGTGVRDCDCALKVFWRDVVQEIPIETDTFFVNAELLARARMSGDSIVEVGVTHRPRLRGQSTVSLRHVFPVGTALLRFWWQNVLLPVKAAPEAADARDWTGRTGWAATVLLYAAALLLFLGNLSYPLIEPDETRYAQIPLEMIQSGDWITPTLDNEPYLDKPPLLYWLTAASYTAFGTNETAARLPCSLAALWTVLLTFHLGKRLIGGRAAWCAAVSLMLCIGFALCGRFLIMDSLLTLFVTATLLFFALAVRQERPRWSYWLAAALACGLGVMTKGPVAPVLTLPPLLALQWLQGRGSTLRWQHWAAFGGIVLLIATPWFIAVSVANGDFTGYFFWRHNIQRFVGGMNHVEPWWFYIPVVLIGMFPLSFLLPVLACFLASRSTEVRSRRIDSLGLPLLAACWVLGFFSISSCKLPPYILPALPMLALLLGSMLDRTVLARPEESGMSALLDLARQRALATILIATVIVAAVDIVLLTDLTLFHTLLDGTALLAAGILLFGIYRMWLRDARRAWPATALLAFVALTFAMADFVPGISRLRSTHLQALRAHRQYAESPLIYFGHDAYSAGLHLTAQEFLHFEADEVAALEKATSQRRETVIVATPYAANRIRKSLGRSATLTRIGGHDRLHLLRRQ